MQYAKLALCSNRAPPVLGLSPLKSLKSSNFSNNPVSLPEGRRNAVVFNADDWKKRHNVCLAAKSASRLGTRTKFVTAATSGGGDSVSELDDNVRKLVQTFLWSMEGVYIVWLFLLPYAPGDPVWAISSETVDSLIGLSLNFFFILPLTNSVGIHVMEAPVLHPMAEGLFNFVIGWTFLFAPLLYTDKRRDRFKGSLDVLWSLQMFLTNTFLIPYMAIRLNRADGESTPTKSSKLGLAMTSGSPIVGLIGGIICLISVLWAIYGRGDGNFGDLQQRWEFLRSYLFSERLAYAFIWDICLYILFQPWLIGDNLRNIQKDKVAAVSLLRFVPVVGVIAYCLCLNADNET